MGGDRNYYVNIHGGNNQNAFGDHSRFEMTVEGGSAIDLDDVFRGIRDSIPEAESEPMVRDVVQPLREIAAESEPENEQDRTTLKARIAEYTAKLEPYAPYIRQTIAAFAEGALSTIPPPASWVVAGVVEVVRDARRA